MDACGLCSCAPIVLRVLWGLWACKDGCPPQQAVEGSWFMTQDGA